ncbi:unnamed protein product [Vitrella brassicaformis CCMP3155]|uniref:RNA helicase n=2 Tax=Vitrella brassicaformis TaxID=1169539 RepID=A0A0G4F325_VITBC|nr:unnamed protein product [Vitrella brassicaformis CCMP3155]|eukprot:CEM06185.1 unnamed protein product [Vitrella brassicaformis CCMP3155]
MEPNYSRGRRYRSRSRSPRRFDDPPSRPPLHSRLKDLWQNSRQLLCDIFPDEREIREPEFDTFFDKYMVLLQRRHDDQGQKGGGGGRKRLSDDVLYRARRSVAALAQRGGRERGGGLSDSVSQELEGDLLEFQRAIEHYRAFRKKSEDEKRRKMDEDRAKLPIAAYEREIVAAVKRFPVVLIQGETGCGKSTQVPQYLLRSRDFESMICTQPRRIAAISLCRRVAQETHQTWGSRIAYQIRFDSTRTQHTKILFVTEGLLLRLLEGDGTVNDFDVVIVDEVHERHITMDLMLGVLKQILAQRPDLRVVLMSATIDTGLFANFFGIPDEAILRVPGRTFPVSVENIPQQDEPETIRTDILTRIRRTELNVQPYLAVIRRIDERVPRDERGDVLVFLSGAYEIDTLVTALREYAQHTRRWIVLPLHSQMGSELQDKVFDLPPAGVRKCVVATNIAETSVTIDGIRFVIDSGKSKEMDVEVTSSVKHLSERWISKAAAEQRKGRAGRTGPGQCWRLYSKRLYDLFEPFALPEMHRVPLEGILLSVLALGYSVHEFDLPDNPPVKNIQAAIQTLVLSKAALKTDADLMAIADETPAADAAADMDNTWPTSVIVSKLLGGKTLRLTPLGRVLSRLPVAISVGKLLIIALLFKKLSHASILAAAMSLHSPFVPKPGGHHFSGVSRDGDDTSVSGMNPKKGPKLGDLFTTHNVYTAWLQQRTSTNSGTTRDAQPYVGRELAGGSRKAHSWCRQHGVDEQRMFELTKLSSQLCDVIKQGVGPDSQARRRRPGLGNVKRRHDAMNALETAIGGAVDDTAPRQEGDEEQQRRDEMRRELRQLKASEGRREKRQLALEDGEGALVEDEDIGGGATRYSEQAEDDYNDQGSGGEGKEREEPRASRKRKRDKKVRVRPDGDRGHLGMEGVSSRVLERHLEFELKYATRADLSQTLRVLTREELSFLRVLVCLSLYPNVALPHPSNQAKASSQDCVFVTRYVAFVNLHPQSSLFPHARDMSDPSVCLVYGSLLQTYKPFVTHVTPVPLLPLLLMAASRVDTNEDFSLLIFDGWIQVMLTQPMLVVAPLLRLTYTLRWNLLVRQDATVQRIFSGQVGDGGQAQEESEDLWESTDVDWGNKDLPDSVPRDLRLVFSDPPQPMSESDLEATLIEFFEQPLEYAPQSLTEREYEAFRKQPGDDTNHKPGQQQEGWEGVELCPWLHFNTIYSTISVEKSLASDQIAVSWECPTCRKTFRFNRRQIAEHKKECGKATTQDGEGEGEGEAEGAAPAASAAEGEMVGGVSASASAASAAGAAVGRGEVWQCEVCGEELRGATSLAILQHKRSHGLG